jgi:hypothetical protein
MAAASAIIVRGAWCIIRSELFGGGNSKRAKKQSTLLTRGRVSLTWSVGEFDDFLVIERAHQPCPNTRSIDFLAS